MDDFQMVTFWKGQPVADLSRDELLEVVAALATELEEYRDPRNMKAFAVGKAEMLRRGA